MTDGKDIFEHARTEASPLGSGDPVQAALRLVVADRPRWRPNPATVQLWDSEFGDWSRTRLHAAVRRALRDHPKSAITVGMIHEADRGLADASYAGCSPAKPPPIEEAEPAPRRAPSWEDPVFARYAERYLRAMESRDEWGQLKTSFEVCGQFEVDGGDGLRAWLRENPKP